MLSAYSGTSPSTASMDASRKDVKMDKSPRRSSLKRPETPPCVRRTLRHSRRLRPAPAGHSARPASTSTRQRVTSFGCRIGYYPEATRILRSSRIIRRAPAGDSGLKRACAPKWAQGPCISVQTSI